MRIFDNSVLSAVENKVGSMMCLIMSKIESNEIGCFFKNIANDVRAFQKQYVAVISPAVEALEKLSDFAGKVPDITREVVNVMGNHGWFMGLDAPFVGQMAIASALKNGDYAGVDKALSAYYKTVAPKLLVKLQARHPSRNEIWRVAFKAHFRGEYILSIPVFLAQADGLWQDGVGRQLYKKNKGSKNKLKSSGLKELSDILCASFDQGFLISKPYSSSGNEFSSLNRHQVLHGKSINYGTELNSLKAISLLDFVSDVVDLAPTRRKIKGIPS